MLNAHSLLSVALIAPLLYAGLRAVLAREDCGTSQPCRSRAMTTYFLVLISAGAAGLLVLEHFGAVGENFHTVVAQRCYRSAQLAPDALQARVKELEIKTVINLRGESSKDWYQQEQSALHESGTRLENVSFDTERLPAPEQVAYLLRLFETAPRPLLLHCKHGVDRTGIAAVLYRTTVQGESVESALGAENSIWSGHFETLSNNAGDRFFELYTSTRSGRSMRDWVTEIYPKIYAAIGPMGGDVSVARGGLNEPYRVAFFLLTPFKIIGILGAVLFASRWLVQAHSSRRAGRPVTPLLFWLMSIAGSLMMLLYFVFSAKQDVVGIISTSFPMFIAVYNLALELRFRARTATELPT